MSKPKLATVDYNEQLVLYYLSKKSDLANQKEIAGETGIYYTTLRGKLKTLEDRGFVFITRKGKEKVVVITEEGQVALTEWEATTAGKKILDDLEKELARVKEQSDVEKPR